MLPPLKPPLLDEHDFGPDDVHIPGHAHMVFSVISCKWKKEHIKSLLYCI